MLLQPNLGIRSKTWGPAFISEFPPKQIAGGAEFCKLFWSRTTGGLIPFQASQPKDRQCTSMLSCNAWQGYSKVDTLLARIYDSENLRYTLHADMEVLNSIGSTNFCYTPV